MKGFVVRVPDELHRQLKHLAKEREQTMSEVVRRSLEDTIKLAKDHKLVHAGE